MIGKPDNQSESLRKSGEFNLIIATLNAIDEQSSNLGENRDYNEAIIMSDLQKTVLHNISKLTNVDEIIEVRSALAITEVQLPNHFLLEAGANIQKALSKVSPEYSDPVADSVDSSFHGVGGIIPYRQGLMDIVDKPN